MLDQTSLYRTKFLMAHNALHDLCHAAETVSVECLKVAWEAYLAELGAAEEVASRPA